jgi:hypothetical protein
MRGAAVIVSSRASAPAADVQVAAEVAGVLERRGAMKHPPVTLAVSDAVALAIAGLFRSESISGRTLDHFHRTGSADSDQLLHAVEIEQAFASPEGHAALHCLRGWVRAQIHRRTPGMQSVG